MFTKMKKMAVCRIYDDLVINIIIANENDLPPENTRLVPIGDGVMCDIGWVFDGNLFINPIQVTSEINDIGVFSTSDDI